MGKWPVNPKRLARGLYWEKAWSLVSGCTPVSAACENCWAASAAHMRRAHPHPAIRNRCQGITDNSGNFNGQVRINEDTLRKPFEQIKAAVWSVWTDLFHERVSFGFAYQAFVIMESCPQHTFLICTKRPERMLDFCLRNFSHPIPNVILMTTAENQVTANLRIHSLVQCVGWRLGLSCEPMLGPVDLTGFERIDWVTCGGESGANARPMNPKWVQSLRNWCYSEKIPFHFKQWGEWLPILDCRWTDTKLSHTKFHQFKNLRAVYRVGKKNAGRKLDGVIHDGFPLCQRPSKVAKR